MQQDLTEIIMVVDRSGSMNDVKKDANIGINRFIKAQRELPGRGNLTLVQFDTEYEFVHRSLPIADVPEYRLEPRGWTALLDALGRAIVETGERLEKMREEDRPGLVVCVIVTDGHENSSREFTLEQIKSMIEHQHDVYKWQFNFLGADAAAFDDAANMGIPMAGAARYDPRKLIAAYGLTSDVIARMRAAASAGRKVSNVFTEAERRKMRGE